MVKINPHLAELKQGYLFPEIQKRKTAFLQKDPTAKVISLGIGDTTRPIVPSVANRLASAAQSLGTKEGYSGYGSEQGNLELREMIANRLYHGQISPDEIFISDGAKCDCGRLQLLFDEQTTVAVQDPTYPVYVDTTLISGKKPQIITMPCTPENGFFPEPVKADFIYLCSPNNPTGSVATREQLAKFISFAKENQAIILFDSAYSHFIQGDDLPRSIFEIEGAEEVAIEVGSFSKLAGFTGVRLGWTIVPKKLRFEEGQSVHDAWKRIVSTFFNGASNIAQVGGTAALQDEGWNEIQQVIAYYMENARIMKETFESLNYRCYGGEHAPYVWVDYSPKTSWDAFDDLLQRSHIVAIPGGGFGPSGDRFLRFSAFASKEEVLEAMARISHLFCKSG